MEKIVKQVETEGIKKLLGKRITVYCCRYIYTGELTGIDDECILLTDAGIVYETGSYDEKEWKDMQKLPNDWYIQKQSIESFGILK